MKTFYSMVLATVASLALHFSSPAVAEAWVYAPGRQPQPSNVAPSSSGNYGYYPGVYGYSAYGYGGLGYNGYRVYGYSGYNYPGYPGFGYPTSGYSSFYSGNTGFPFYAPFGGVIQRQYGFPWGYGY